MIALRVLVFLLLVGKASLALDPAALLVFAIFAGVLILRTE